MEQDNGNEDCENVGDEHEKAVAVDGDGEHHHHHHHHHHHVSAGPNHEDDEDQTSLDHLNLRDDGSVQRFLESMGKIDESHQSSS